MPTYNLLIATSDKTLFHADVTAAIFVGTQGVFEVLAHHAPIIAMVKNGSVKITDAHGHEHKIEVGEGFFEFHSNKGVLVADQKM